jgi:hypothetical protein
MWSTLGLTTASVVAVLSLMLVAGIMLAAWCEFQSAWAFTLKDDGMGDTVVSAITLSTFLAVLALACRRTAWRAIDYFALTGHTQPLLPQVRGPSPRLRAPTTPVVVSTAAAGIRRVRSGG